MNFGVISYRREKLGQVKSSKEVKLPLLVESSILLLLYYSGCVIFSRKGLSYN